MLTILACTFTDHNLTLLIAALGMCVFACGTSRALILRARASEGRVRRFWKVSAGVVAGIGIWATHFVAMLAYQTPLPISFDIALTVTSAVIAVAACSIAGLISQRAGGLLAGLVFGAGVIAMHYVGISAIEMPARFAGDTGTILVSILMGLALGAVAGHLAARQASTATNIGSVLARVVTILATHFIAMGALTITPTIDHAPSNSTFSAAAISILVMAACAFIVGQALIAAMVDRHLKSHAQQEQERLRAYIAELETVRESLQRTSREALAANNTKSAFLAAMSHELRTPLNAILGFAEIIHSEILGPVGHPKYLAYSGDIHRSGKHLLAVINDILDISKLEAKKSELIESQADICAVLEDVLAQTSIQARDAGLTIVKNCPARAPRVWLDERRFRQVLLNLLSNAIKFTPSGGRISLSLTFADGVTLSVEDSGIGISPEDLSKAFESFGQIDSRLSRKYEGTGLGLPIARHIIELHGGTLTLESRLEVGTRAIVRLPASRILPDSLAEDRLRIA